MVTEFVSVLQCHTKLKKMRQFVSQVLSTELGLPPAVQSKADACTHCSTENCWITVKGWQKIQTAHTFTETPTSKYITVQEVPQECNPTCTFETLY